MAIWEVEYTDEFERWWHQLEEYQQDAVAVAVRLLEERGIALGFPLSSAIQASRHPRMRELRIQVRGRALRVLYAFDPRRTAILLLGGDKTGDDRWYDHAVPAADRLYDEHLTSLHEEGQG